MTIVDSFIVDTTTFQRECIVCHAPLSDDEPNILCDKPQCRAEWYARHNVPGWVQRVSTTRAAEMLGLTQHTVWTYAKEGKIKSVRAGRRTLLISIDDLRKFAKERGIELKEDK